MAFTAGMADKLPIFKQLLPRASPFEQQAVKQFPIAHKAGGVLTDLAVFSALFEVTPAFIFKAAGLSTKIPAIARAITGADKLGRVFVQHKGLEMLSEQLETGEVKTPDVIREMGKSYATGVGTDLVFRGALTGIAKIVRVARKVGKQEVLTPKEQGIAKEIGAEKLDKIYKKKVVESGVKLPSITKKDKLVVNTIYLRNLLKAGKIEKAQQLVNELPEGADKLIWNRQIKIQKDIMKKRVVEGITRVKTGVKPEIGETIGKTEGETATETIAKTLTETGVGADRVVSEKVIKEAEPGRLLASKPFTPKVSRPPEDSPYQIVKAGGGVRPFKKSAATGKTPEWEEYNHYVPLGLRRKASSTANAPDEWANELYNRGILGEPTDDAFYKWLKSGPKSYEFEPPPDPRFALTGKGLAELPQGTKIITPQDAFTIKAKIPKGVKIEDGKKYLVRPQDWVDILEITPPTELQAQRIAGRGAALEQPKIKTLEEEKQAIFDKWVLSRFDLSLKKITPSVLGGTKETEFGGSVSRLLRKGLLEGSRGIGYKRVEHKMFEPKYTKLVVPEKGIPGVPYKKEDLFEPKTTQKTKDMFAEQGGAVDLSELSEFLGTNRRIVNAVSKAWGGKNAIYHQQVNKKNIILARMLKGGVRNKEDAISIFNHIDNPEKYSLPKHLDNPRIKKQIKITRDQTERLRKDLQSSNLLGDEFIDDERYIMTILENIDGTPPSKTQMLALQNGATKPLREAMRDLLYKPDPTEPRKYLTADIRDVVLKRIMTEAGLPTLQTKRNFFDVYDKYVERATSRLMDAEFIKSLREDAKTNSPDVKEWFDPAEYRQFKNNLKEKVKDRVKKIISEGKEAKTIAYPLRNKIASNLDKLIENTKLNIGSAEIGVQDLFKIQKKETRAELELFSTSLTEYILKEVGTKRVSSIINDAIRNEIKNIRATALSNLGAKHTEYLKKYIKYTDEMGYVFPKENITIKRYSQLTGLLFSPQQARALEKVSQILRPSSLEDIIRAGKVVISTGDLFQFPEMLRQMASIDPLHFLSNIKKVIGMSPEKLYERGTDQVRYGLVLRRPADVDIELFRTTSEKLMNKILAEGDKSTFKRLYQEAGEMVDKIPVIRHLKKGIFTGLGALEKAQWEWALPRVKSVMHEILVPKFQKKYNYTPEEAKTGAAIFVNKMFQGLNWKHLMTENTPFGRSITAGRERFLRLIFFGSDRLTSVWLRYAGLGGRHASFYWYWLVKGTVISGSILEGLSYAINGKSTFENKNGKWWELELPLKDEKGNNMSVNVLGTFIEPLRMVEAPTKYGIAKLGIMPRFLEIGEKDYYKTQTFNELVWKFQPIPMSMQVLTSQLRKREGKQWGEVGLKTAILQSGLEFAGYPTTFRSKDPRYARIQDLFSGKANLYQYLLSRDLKKPPKPEKPPTLTLKKLTL